MSCLSLFLQLLPQPLLDKRPLPYMLVGENFLLLCQSKSVAFSQNLDGIHLLVLHSSHRKAVAHYENWYYQTIVFEYYVSKSVVSSISPVPSPQPSGWSPKLSKTCPQEQRFELGGGRRKVSPTMCEQRL